MNSLPELPTELTGHLLTITLVGCIMFSSSFFYQAYALPRQIVANHHDRAVAGVYSAIFLAAVAYISSAAWDALHGDWVGFSSRLPGALMSPIIAAQAVWFYYQCKRLSRQQAEALAVALQEIAIGPGVPVCSASGVQRLDEERNQIIDTDTSSVEASRPTVAKKPFLGVARTIDPATGEKRVEVWSNCQTPIELNVAFVAPDGTMHPMAAEVLDDPR